MLNYKLLEESPKFPAAMAIWQRHYERTAAGNVRATSAALAELEFREARIPEAVKKAAGNVAARAFAEKRAFDGPGGALTERLSGTAHHEVSAWADEAGIPVQAVLRAALDELKAAAARAGLTVPDFLTGGGAEAGKAATRATRDGR